MSKRKRRIVKKAATRRRVRRKVTARPDEPLVVRPRGVALARDLRAGKRRRPMNKRDKIALLKKVAPQLKDTGLWDYAYLTARDPWIDNVARLAVSHASMRSNPNDFLMSASDGDYHKPYAGVYFRAPAANAPILVNFIVNALRSQTVHTQAGGTVQATTLSPGFHYVSIIVVPPTANLHFASLTTQKGDPHQSLLELEAVELTTLK